MTERKGGLGLCDRRGVRTVVITWGSEQPDGFFSKESGERQCGRGRISFFGRGVLVVRVRVRLEGLPDGEELPWTVLFVDVSVQGVVEKLNRIISICRLLLPRYHIHSDKERGATACCKLWTWEEMLIHR